MENHLEEILTKLTSIENRIAALESRILNSKFIEYIEISKHMPLADEVMLFMQKQDSLSLTSAQVMKQFNTSWAVAERILNYLFFKQLVVKTSVEGNQPIYSLRTPEHNKPW